MGEGSPPLPVSLVKITKFVKSVLSVDWGIFLIDSKIALKMFLLPCDIIQCFCALFPSLILKLWAT